VCTLLVFVGSLLTRKILFYYINIFSICFREFIFLWKHNFVQAFCFSISFNLLIGFIRNRDGVRILLQYTRVEDKCLQGMHLASTDLGGSWIKQCFSKKLLFFKLIFYIYFWIFLCIDINFFIYFQEKNTQKPTIIIFSNTHIIFYFPFSITKV